MDHSTRENHYTRKIIPGDIKVPPGYKTSVFAKNLTTPISLIISQEGDLLLADAGITDGDGKVLKFRNNKFEVLASGFTPPLTGINTYKGDIYVSHRGFITLIKPDGRMEDIISGLPSLGDHHNNKVVFGPDDKMYFGQGTATNSGVVGEDNEAWVRNYPFFHDYPGENIVLEEKSYTTSNFLIPADQAPARTCAYSPFNMPPSPHTSIRRVVPANGSILRANPDGSNLELVAWGLRNPFSIQFDSLGRLFCANHGADVRGSRPIDKCPDEFQLIMPGIWYGWPDYSAGLPVTLPMFKPEGMPAPAFLLADHPMKPPRPFVCFPNHSAIMGFDFYQDDPYISEFGSLAPTTTGGKPDPEVGHRVSKITMTSGQISDFARNKTGLRATATNGGGLERPIDLIFDSQGNMYIVDFGISPPDSPGEFIPGSGVIWMVSKD